MINTIVHSSFPLPFLAPSVSSIFHFYLSFFVLLCVAAFSTFLLYHFPSVPSLSFPLSANPLPFFGGVVGTNRHIPVDYSFLDEFKRISYMHF